MTGHVLNFPRSVLQYADGILVFAASEEFPSQGTHVLLNFLADRDYKLSKAKTQLCSMR